jgi:hypothetical protein
MTDLNDVTRMIEPACCWRNNQSEHFSTEGLL